MWMELPGKRLPCNERRRRRKESCPPTEARKTGVRRRRREAAFQKSRTMFRFLPLELYCRRKQARADPNGVVESCRTDWPERAATSFGLFLPAKTEESKESLDDAGKV